MKLDTFVAETLQQIVMGVTDAQQRVKDTDALINPNRGSEYRLQLVEFDVELSTAETAGLKTGFGVFVGGLGAGTRGESEGTSQKVGRIKFKVPIELPLQADRPVRRG